MRFNQARSLNSLMNDAVTMALLPRWTFSVNALMSASRSGPRRLVACPPTPRRDDSSARRTSGSQFATVSRVGNFGNRAGQRPAQG